MDGDYDVDDGDLNLFLSSVDNPLSLQNQVDLDTLLGNFGRNDLGPLSVPEPSSIALAFMGILGLLSFGRSRRK